MQNPCRVRGLSSIVAGAVAGLVLASSPARAWYGSPNFNGVTWTPLDCAPGGDPQNDENPGSVDFVGDATHPSAYVAQDAKFLYFRYRVDECPSGPGGFDQYVWTALMQVPTGDQFQYQYQLSLNGKGGSDSFGNSGDTIEMWANTSAKDIDFSPIFNDPSETRLFAQVYGFSSASTVNTSPLARYLVANDGSHFGGDADYFVDFAFPISVMISKGIIGSAADLASALFFPATATDANNYNKDHLDCSFLPATTLQVDKTVAPTSVAANVTSPVSYTIAVKNAGTANAHGVVVEDPGFPPFVSNLAVGVSSDDPAATWTVVGTNPLTVKVPHLAAGKTVTVTVTGTAHPSCADQAFTNTATAAASNAMPASDTAILTPHAGAEVCDGIDNDCDGDVDEGGASLCDNADKCHPQVCGGASGCQPAPALDCDDHDACTVDSCAAATGCVHDPIPGCTPCTTANDCNDHDACTSDSCIAGVCQRANAVVCTALDQCHDAGTCNPESGACSNPAKANGTSCDDGNACTRTDTCQAGICTGTNPVVCTALDQCHDAGTCNPQNGTCSNPSKSNGTACNDGNACTGTDVCQAGVCMGVAVDGCVLCESASDCDDHNACTTDTCDDSVCHHATLSECTPCAVDGDCSDGNGCTIDTCRSGKCAHETVAGCTPCGTAAQCDDKNICTDEVCDENGVCQHTPIPDCRPCAVDADCDDENPCTTDKCGDDGSCQETVIQGCVRCETAVDCNDQNACTADTCSGGACQHAQLPDCPACVPTTEICNDGKDNDCDGLVDCADPNCSASPACLKEKPREICGDCIDNDGNGLTDYEDPACCEQMANLGLRAMLIRAKGPRRRSDHLRLVTLFSPTVLPGFDPLTQDTTLQIADGNGQLFCKTIGAMHWMRMRHPRQISFWDRKGLYAGGLADGRFLTKKKSRVFFRTHGWRVPVRTLKGNNLRVTVRVGGRCVTTTAALRTKKKGLVFP